MAQAFVTSYQFFFRDIRQDRVEPINPYKLTDIQLEDDEDLWLHQKSVSTNATDDSYLEEGAKLVKHMLLKRLKTTYQVSYCKDKASSRREEDADVEEKPKGNELLEYCKNLYGRRNLKLLPPLPSSRRVYGYIRPARAFTPLTTYQHEIGGVGYTLLDR